MNERFDEAKRALDGVAAPDVWAEAQRRAGDDGVASVVPLPPPSRRVRRPARWLAAAAAVAVVAGTVAVLVSDGDAPLDTGPSSADGDGGLAGTKITRYQAEGACELGISGNPLPEPVAVTPAETFVEGSVGTLAAGDLNDVQRFEVQVPGQVVTDLLGERVEDVQLRRGTGGVWFREQAAPDGAPESAVQVRWFTGSQAPCDSFTVTVAGGTEDENRHAAVDLAERVLLPSELPTADDRLAGTRWQLERSTVAGTPTNGDGSVFTFTDTDVTWSDGCNTFSGPYTSSGDSLELRTTTEVTRTLVECDTNPTMEAVHEVMTGTVAVTFDGELLELRRGDTTLVLRPADLDAGDPGGPEDPARSEPYGIWPMTGPERIFGYRPEVIASAEDTAVEFARRVLGWADAQIVEPSGEPTHDGIGVLSARVASPALDREVGVLVRQADPATDGHNVYLVGSPDVGSASVRVNDGVGSVHLSSVPSGTASSEVMFVYGEYSYDGVLDQDIVFRETSEWDEEAPGAVLVLFRNGDGDVLGAWGRALPPGPFAAS